tara:strand:- start:505 stop:744 length:240 start_codon:yes stop_codon:yes gene_type:complete
VEDSKAQDEDDRYLRGTDVVFSKCGSGSQNFECLFWPKIAPKEYLWVKISGTDAGNHEESEISLEIVQKFNKKNIKFKF